MLYQGVPQVGGLTCALLLVLCSAGFGGCSSSPLAQATDKMPVIEGEDGPVSEREAGHSIENAVKDAPNPAATASLLTTIDALADAPLYKDSRVTLLVDGPPTYDAMIAAIESAQHTIHLETYIFADDKIGRMFADALITRRKAGVVIRIIYDSLGSRESADEFFERMTDAGIELVAYNAVNPVDGGNPLDANNRTHRKLLIVDDRIAFTGGINISRFYSRASDDPRRSSPLSAGWRDTHIAIEGPAVKAFQKIFSANWEGDNADLTSEEATTASSPDSSDDIVAVLQAIGGDGEESAIFHAYLEAMRVAEDRIWITQGYFAPDERFTNLIVAAVGRGVDVRLLVPGFSDTNVVVHASRSRYGGLLKKGIRIYETKSTVLHAKTAVMDGTWSTVGSSNLDNRSFLHNDEVNAVIFGSDFGSQMESQFLADIEQAEVVTLAKWKKRTLGDRVREFFSWTVEYWL